MVKFISGIRKIRLANDLAILLGILVQIDDQDGIGLSVAAIIQAGNISVFLLGSFHRHFR
jgi:hypothetical protein